MDWMEGWQETEKLNNRGEEAWRNKSSGEKSGMAVWDVLTLRCLLAKGDVKRQPDTPVWGAAEREKFRALCIYLFILKDFFKFI